MPGTCSLGCDRRGDPVSIGNLLGRPADRARRGRTAAAGDVARADDHREDPLEEAVLVGQRLDVADLDLDGHPRLDVGHGLGKDVRPFLVQEAGDFTRGARGLVNPARFLFLLDLSHHAPAPDEHHHPVDGGLVRQGKDVERLDLLVRLVDEGLAHRRTPHEGRDLGTDIGVAQGAGTAGLAIRCHDQQLSRVGSGVLLRRHGPAGQDGEQRRGGCDLGQFSCPVPSTRRSHRRSSCGSPVFRVPESIDTAGAERFPAIFALGNAPPQAGIA